mmetsp:Transcript_60345/g.134606  ORF Transcript_60345/g.134606 Transcript_60345/m.134606 type:complete len:207 (+) Transcript_60345:1-621(+)
MGCSMSACTADKEEVQACALKAGTVTESELDISDLQLWVSEQALEPLGREGKLESVEAEPSTSGGEPDAISEESQPLSMSVQVNVPEHLRRVIKEEKVLHDYVQPRQWSSWASVPLQEADIPADVMLPPGRETHEEYVKTLDKFLKRICTSSHFLDDEVSSKRKRSRMEPLPRSRKTWGVRMWAPKISSATGSSRFKLGFRIESLG